MLSWRPNKSVRSRLVSWTALLVVVIVVGLTGLLLYNQNSALRAISSQVTELTSRLKEQQQETVKSIGSRQQGQSAAALKQKAVSLANLMAKLAAVPLLTFETGALDNYCKQVCLDRDVVLCSVRNAKGAIVSGFSKDTARAGSTASAGSDKHVPASAGSSPAENDTMETTVNVTQDGKNLGEVTIRVSKRSAREQTVEIRENFDQFESKMDSTFSALKNGLDDQTRVQAARSAFLGLAAGCLAVFGGIVAALQIGRGIARPLQSAVSVLESIASGDLSRRMAIDFNSHDEMGCMAKALNDAVGAVAKATEEKMREAARLEQQVRDEHNALERMAAEQLHHKTDNLVQVVAAAAQGDLTQRVTVDGKEAIDELASSIGKMLEDLSQIIGGVSDTAVQFAEGARTIAENSQTLAAARKRRIPASTR